MLIEQLGLEGYGIYWVLIETLRDQPNYKYPVALIPAIARRYNTTTEKMKTVVNGYGFFVVDENEFFSLSLIERMAKLDDKREKNRIAGLKSAQKRLLLNTGSTDVQQTFNECSTHDEPVKESKVNKSRVKENTTLISGYTENKALIESLNDFIKMRKAIRKPMTEKAVMMMLNKLEKLADTDETKIAVLDQSTLNCWSDIYELKQPIKKAQQAMPTTTAISAQTAWEEVYSKLVINPSNKVEFSTDLITRAVKSVGFLSIINGKAAAMPQFVKAYNDLRGG